MNETVKLLISHRSIRKFKAQAVEEEKIGAIIEAAQWSSTSSHYQAYTIINVVNSKKRQTIAEVAGQKWVVECPLFLVFCADLHRSKKYWQGTEPSAFGNTDLSLVATVDATLAAQKAFIAAQSLGLGGVIVGGIRNDLKLISETLALPELVYPVFGMCLGYPDDEPDQKPRLPKDVIYKIDEYNEEGDEGLLAAYDQVIKQYYIERSGGKIQDTWSMRCGKFMMEKTRDDVLDFIIEKGFFQK